MVWGLGLLMQNVDAGHTCIHCACMCMNGCVTYLGVLVHYCASA